MLLHFITHAYFNLQLIVDSASDKSHIIHNIRVIYCGQGGVMRVLLIGSGGREHALTKALLASPRLTTLTVAPGNPGIALDAPTAPLTTLADVQTWLATHPTDLVVICPKPHLLPAGLTLFVRWASLCLGRHNRRLASKAVKVLPNK
jgi:predicted AAA+ superfamily ATPase